MTSEPRKMSVIPESEVRAKSVVAPSFEGAAIQGQGSLSYACGGCGTTLILNVQFMQVRNIVIKCFGCNAFNEIPASHHTH